MERPRGGGRAVGLLHRLWRRRRRRAARAFRPMGGGGPHRRRGGLSVPGQRQRPTPDRPGWRRPRARGLERGPANPGRPLPSRHGLAAARGRGRLDRRLRSRPRAGRRRLGGRAPPVGSRGRRRRGGAQPAGELERAEPGLVHAGGPPAGREPWRERRGGGCGPHGLRPRRIARPPRVHVCAGGWLESVRAADRGRAGAADRPDRRRVSSAILQE